MNVSRSATDRGLTPSRPPVAGRGALLGLVVVVTATVLLCLPFLRAVYWLGDEGILLRGAAVLAAGGKIYTDFFAFYPPAGYLIMEGWLKIFGPSFLAVRLFAILMIAVIMPKPHVVPFVDHLFSYIRIKF